MSNQRPGEWAESLLNRFEEELPYRVSAGGQYAYPNHGQTAHTLIKISVFRFSLVIQGLTKHLQRVNELFQVHDKSWQHEIDSNYYDSIVVILSTLESCLLNQSKETARFEEAQNVKLLLREICQYMSPMSDEKGDINPSALSIRMLSSKVLYALSQTHFGAVFGRITSRMQELSTCSDEGLDYCDIDLIQHIDLNLTRLLKLLSEIIQKFRLIKKAGQAVLLVALESAIWNWIEWHTEEFVLIQLNPNEELTRYCENLFDIFDAYLENKKTRYTVWPLQMLLLALNRKVLEEIVQAETGAQCSPRHVKKKQFLEGIRRNLLAASTSNKPNNEWATIACVKLCKFSTYLDLEDNLNVIHQLVYSVQRDLKALLFNPAKPYCQRNQQNMHSHEVDMMIECWVAMYRINPSSMDSLRTCLHLSAPTAYHYMIVKSLWRIVTQERHSWWPEPVSLYQHSAELKCLFRDTLQRVNQGGYIAHTPSRLIPTLSLKSKQSQVQRTDDCNGHRSLLLLLISLIHADPVLVLNGGTDDEISTLELMSGLVSLVHQPTMPDVADEAMAALLALHAPSRIELWNPHEPINTFWDVSSHVISALCQKLIERQIINYPEVLKWLRSIIMCRNSFLMLHKEYANVGRTSAICQEAHIKLEMVFFMYLWSVELEAVLTALSCFGLLCKEADIRCSVQDLVPATILPNYQLYSELALAAHSVSPYAAAAESKYCFYEQKQGRAVLQKQIMSLLRRIEQCVNGVQPAWEETFRNWEHTCKVLQSYPKKTEESTQEVVHHRSTGKRRTSHQSSEHDLEEHINEWANMTWFLVALGGVCLQQRPRIYRSFGCSPPTPASQAALAQTPVQPAATAQSPSQPSQPSQPSASQCHSVAKPVVATPSEAGTSSQVTQAQVAAAVSAAMSSSGAHCLTPGTSAPPMSIGTATANSAGRDSYIANYVRPTADVLYCPVTQFIAQLLRLLVFTHDKFGLHMQKHVKELIAIEMSTHLFPLMFEQIRSIIEKFFDPQGQAIVDEANTRFVEHTIFIMKSVLDVRNGAGEPEDDNLAASEHLSVTSIEAMILGIVRYVRHLDMTVHTVHIKTKLCQLVELMMKRRDDLAFRQEMKFRNKMVEYLTDWVLGTSHQISAPGNGADLLLNYTVIFRDLDQACMEAVAALLRGLPLQPEESDRGDLMDAKTALFTKYFTLFMNLLNDNADTADGDKDMDPTRAIATRGPRRSSVSAVNKQTALRNATIQAMSNLLSANIDSGLLPSIDLGYHADLQTRAAFLEVLTLTLQQGTEFDTLAETVLADRFEQLVQLVTMISDKGELPIAMALASVVTSAQMDELARVMVTLFDAKHMLAPMLWNMFYREVEVSDCMQTLFRGNSLGSKIMAYCFKLFGAKYLESLLEPLIRPLLDDSVVQPHYEVDPARIDPEECIQTNRANLIALTHKVFNSILCSADRFPVQLRSMCHCLYQVLSKRFPSFLHNNIGAVGTVIFLRFINPAIVSPQEMGIVKERVPPTVKRGLMLMSKILQNIANHVEFSKEQHMLVFNEFIRVQFEGARRFFIQIASDCETVDTTQCTTYVSDTNVLALHRLLFTHQERIGDYLSSSRDHKAVGRRPFDKMVTLLAYLGPPEHKPLDQNAIFTSFTRWSSIDMSSNNFEDIMIKHHMQEKEEFKYLKSLNIFYQAGTSRAGYPVFYFIMRRFKIGEVNGDLLIYHVILTLKPFCHAPYDLVVDFTHTNADNRFRTEYLAKWFYVMPEKIYAKINACYVYNMNTWVREYAKYHDRILYNMKNSRKFVFMETLAALLQYISAEQHRLPGATLSLEEDLKVYPGVLRLSHKDTRVLLKIGPTSFQVQSAEKAKVLNIPAFLTDIYYASEIDEVIQIDDNQFNLHLIYDMAPQTFIYNDCDIIVSAVTHIRNRWELSQPASKDTPPIHQKIRPKDVPGTLLNMAMLNMGTSEPILRTAAYNLLCALSAAFDLKIEGNLRETQGLCIPANNTNFIKSVSEKLAENEPHLTLEFLEECIQGFHLSTTDLKHLCLDYMSPWLKNLVKFCKSNDEIKRMKVNNILEKLIHMTIEQRELYPSIQAKIWSPMGTIPELIDVVLDNFIQKSVSYGLGSAQVEIMADTAVALAAENVHLVAKKVIGRLCRVLDKTCLHPTDYLEQQILWDDIAILSRFLLMLSFNNCLDVIQHLPFLFHIVTFLVCTGSMQMRAATHGLVINVIHSLCTCTEPNFPEDTKRMLRLALDEFSLPKFYLLFGISKVKSPAVTAFRNSCSHQSDRWPGNERLMQPAPEQERVSLHSLEVITDALLEIMEAGMTALPECQWLNVWSQLARNFAFSHNPALQPRALIVLGCICKVVPDLEVKEVLRILVTALESYTDRTLIQALVMCLTRVQPVLLPSSKVHRALFWVAINVLKLKEYPAYAVGLQLLEQNLHTLDSENVFETRSIVDVMMEARQPVEWQAKQLDASVGLSFNDNFHFALVGHLLKGFRHPSATTVTRTSRVLSMLLAIVAKPEKRDKFEVTPDSVAYLTALVPVSEEVRLRCHVRHSLPGCLAKDMHTSQEPFCSHTNIVQRQQSQETIESNASQPTGSQSNNERASESNESNVLLDPEVLPDLSTQALVLTVLATLVKYSNDNQELRVLYQYLAEGSVVFQRVFSVIHSLLDQKINNILLFSHDHIVLLSVQSIIQNMLTSEDSAQQQLNFVHSCGFGGLWRFAGPFIKLELIPARDDICHLFISYLEVLLMKVMPPDEPGILVKYVPRGTPMIPPPGIQSSMLSSSLSSLTIGSPTDKAFSVESLERFDSGSLRRGSTAPSRVRSGSTSNRDSS